MACPLWARHWVVAGPDQTPAFWALPVWWDEEQHAYPSSSEKVGPSGLWGRVGMRAILLVWKVRYWKAWGIEGRKTCLRSQRCQGPTSQLFWEWPGRPHDFWNEAKGLNWTRWTEGTGVFWFFPPCPSWPTFPYVLLPFFQEHKALSPASPTWVDGPGDFQTFSCV